MKKTLFILVMFVVLTVNAHAATLYNNFPASKATYYGGSGADTITAVDANNNSFFVAGKGPNYAPSGVTPSGSGEGLLTRYNLDGTPAAAVRLSSEILDMEANSTGQVVVCGSFGISLFDANDLSTPLFSNEIIGTVSRCAVGDDGTSAGISGNSIYVFNLVGTQVGNWNSGASSRSFNDVAVHSESQTVIEAGQNQAAGNLQVAFFKGRTFTGDIKWTNYDFSASEVFDANLGADSRGERVAIGEDGKLYFSGYVDGGNAIYGRNPRNITESLSNTQLIKTDNYTNPFQISGAKALGWYGRFNPSTGNLERGQFLLTRLSNGDGNSISIKAITASSDGTVYLGGEAYASIQNRANLQVAGTTIGGYSAGEPFVFVASPDLTQRLFWTSFAAPGKSAGGSPAYGVAVRGNSAVLGATLKLTDGQRAITVNAAQGDVGGGTSDGYLVFWGTNIETLDKPLLTSPANGTTVNTHSPSFQWTGAGATQVKVTVKNAQGVKVFKEKYNAADVCSDTGCSVSPGAGTNFSLKNGAGYTWKVVAQNALTTVKSDKATFAVDFPGTPILSSPAADANVSSTPTLEWSEIDAATEYKIVIKRVSDGVKIDTGSWTSGTTLCGGGTCSYTLSEALSTGAYTWRVQTRQNPIPNKSKSERRTFTVTSSMGLLPLDGGRAGK
jgi:hypothetical protein